MKNRIDFITMGCSKNLVDSEQLMRRFEQEGYQMTSPDGDLYDTGSDDYTDEEEEYFEDEEERNQFVEHIRQTEGVGIYTLEDGQWLQVNFEEYSVENGRINYDLGIRHSSHVLVDQGTD